MRNKLILLLAILFGAIAAFGAFQYMRTVEATYQLSGNYTQVATAKQTIPARATIQGSMLEFVEVPVEYVMPGAILDPADAVGKLARTLSERIGAESASWALGATREVSRSLHVIPFTIKTA